MRRSVGRSTEEMRCHRPVVVVEGVSCEAMTDRPRTPGHAGPLRHLSRSADPQPQFARARTPPFFAELEPRLAQQGPNARPRRTSS
eukprot:scaffold11735_cov112-Isochrysis_galbana.AAC.3